MAISKQMSLAIIACAQMGSSIKLCKEPASPGCVEPFLESEEANDVDFAWKLWKSKFNKVYDSHDEETYRHHVWTSNTEYMTRHNDQPNLTYSLTWHSTSDWTSDEFRQYRRLDREQPGSLEGAFGAAHRGTFTSGSHDGKLRDLPGEWDWSLASPEVVTYVKNQQCGDCWAFSATGALEGALAVAVGWTTSLSAQQFVDCDDPWDCDGGIAGRAMDWAKDNFVCSWDSYPETGHNGICNRNCQQIINPGSIWGTYDVTKGDEGALCLALLQRPITVAVCVDDTFANYGGGILDYQSCTSLNHAVLAVGYGYYNGAGYWKIKNSWGTGMGLEGYWLLARGDGKNQNGVMNQAVGVYVYGPYNPPMSLTDSQGMRISAPSQAQVVA